MPKAIKGPLLYRAKIAADNRHILPRLYIYYKLQIISYKRPTALTLVQLGTFLHTPQYKNWTKCKLPIYLLEMILALLVGFMLSRLCKPSILPLPE